MAQIPNVINGQEYPLSWLTGESLNDINNTATGVPNSPTTTVPVSTPKAPYPKRVFNDTIKSKLLRPSLTSHFQCNFNPPNVQEIRQYYLDGGDTITLHCTEASLPGSSILTNELNDDYTGITERIGYRRQYDNTTDFTFYVDHGTINGGYNTIRLFESWIRYAMGETSVAPDGNYFYRVRFPDTPGTGYRNEIFIQKFERDYLGNYLQYTFVRAYPISIASMPVSYESSQLLKCTVSFTYNRYLINNLGYENGGESSQSPAIGVPNQTQFSQKPGNTNATAPTGIPADGEDPLFNTGRITPITSRNRNQVITGGFIR